VRREARPWTMPRPEPEWLKTLNRERDQGNRERVRARLAGPPTRSWPAWHGRRSRRSKGADGNGPATVSFRWIPGPGTETGRMARRELAP
jgi:hypothetical protein